MNRMSSPENVKPSPWGAVLLGLLCLTGTLWYWQTLRAQERAAPCLTAPGAVPAGPARLLSTTALVGGSLISLLLGFGLYTVRYDRRLNQLLREEIEDHEETEDRLRRSEARFRQVVEHSSEVFWLATPDKSRLLYVSPAYETIWGRTCESLLRSPDVWFETVHPDDRDRVRAGRGTSPSPFREIEYRILRPDGAERWIRERTYPARNSRGAITAVAGIAQDITAYKEAALAVQRQHELMTAILDGASEAISVKDRRGRYVLINKAGAEFIHKTPKEVLGQDDTALFPADFAAATMATDRTVMERRTVETRDEAEHRREGNRTFLTRKYPYLDLDGEVAGVIGISRDVTEQRSAEARLRQSEAQLYQLFFEAPAGLVIVDAQTRLLRVNQAFCDLVGYEERDIIGNPIAAYTHPEDLPASLALMQSFFRGERPAYRLETRCLRKNGESIWAAVSAKGIVLPNHSSPVLLATVEDVTARKQAESEIRSLHDQLERRIEERTAELVQAQQLVQQVVDSSPDWIFAKDREHRFLLVNRSFANAQGLTPEQMIGRPDTDFWSRELCEGNPDKHIRGFHNDDREAFEGRTVHNPSDPATRADGTIRIFDTHKGPLREADGSVSGVLCYCRDVTEQRQAQDVLQQAKRDLERHVAQRTAELALANHRLQQDIAARKQAEEALRESEKRFKLFMDNNPAIAFMKDQQGRYVYVNGTWERLYTGDWQGKTDQELWSEETASLFRESDRRAIEQGKPTESVETVLDREGRPQDWWVMKFPVIASTGERLVGGVAIDITERKRVEEALRESRQRLHTIMEGTSDAVYIKDLQGRYLLLNAAASRFVGKSPDEVLGHDDTFIFPHDDAKAVMEGDRAVMAGGQTVTYEEHVTTADGERRTFLATKGPLFDAEGVVSGLFGIARDITERKLMEDRLRTTQYAVDHAADQIFLIGHDGYFLDVNESACRRLGYTKQELLTMSVMDIDPDFPPAVWDAFWAEFTRTKQIHLETRHRSKSGEIYPVEVVANYHLHNGQELDYAIVRDITERRKAEEERLSLLRELQSANAALGHLSHQLMQVQETERQQLARDLHDEIGQALTAVTINLQSLGRRHAQAGEAPEMRDSLSIVENLVQHVRDLCLDLRPSMLDDLGLIPALRWYVTRQAARAGWLIDFQVDDAIPALPEPVQVACYRIAQEALTNAMRHAAARRLVVRLRCVEDILELSVTDDGVGFTVPAAGPSVGKGGGLGLIGMKERARFAGGDWTIASTPGRGTTVQARLPINGLATTKAGQFSEALT